MTVTGDTACGTDSRTSKENNVTAVPLDELGEKFDFALELFSTVDVLAVLLVTVMVVISE